MTATVEPQLAQLHHHFTGHSILLRGRRAVCRDHGVDNGVPEWMGEWHEVKPRSPAHINALLDALEHNLLEHPDEMKASHREVEDDTWHRLLYGEES